MGAWGSNLDLSQVKEFYDPHPCPYGALFGVPIGVKEVLDSLNGQNISIREAMNRINAVTKVGVYSQKDFICLEVACGGRYDVAHTFCLIKFR